MGDLMSLTCSAWHTCASRFKQDAENRSRSFDQTDQQQSTNNALVVCKGLSDGAAPAFNEDTAEIDKSSNIVLNISFSHSNSVEQTSGSLVYDNPPEE